MVAEVLYTRVPNTIEYGPNVLMIHGVHTAEGTVGDAASKKFAQQVIKAAGGVSIIAHPCSSLRESSTGEKSKLTSEFFNELKKVGLNGIEVDHRDHGIEERLILRKIASDLDLITTGSSDFHGAGKLNLIGENVTSPEHWVRLESMANARRVISA